MSVTVPSNVVLFPYSSKVKHVKNLSKKEWENLEESIKKRDSVLQKLRSIKYVPAEKLLYHCNDIRFQYMRKPFPHELDLENPTLKYEDSLYDSRIEKKLEVKSFTRFQKHCFSKWENKSSGLNKEFLVDLFTKHKSVYYLFYNDLLFACFNNDIVTTHSISSDRIIRLYSEIENMTKSKRIEVLKLYLNTLQMYDARLFIIVQNY